MTIKFFLQANTNPASIYVRIREGKQIDAKANTGILVNPEVFNKGEIKLLRINPKATAESKNKIQEQNNHLNELQAQLNNLRGHISNLLNNKKDYEIIDTKWLKEALNPSNEADKLPSNITDYFEKYLEHKKASLAASTIKKLKSIKSRIERFEIETGRVFIQNIDNKFSKKFQLWMDNKGYDHNTKVKTLKVIKTVCNHASENGIPINPQLKSILKDLRYKNSEHIHLNLNEISQIIETNIEDKKLDCAKDWLIISCFTAQRVSDFLRFSKDNIVQMEGHDFLDITQNKTDVPVYVPLSPEVKQILDKRNGEFPPIFSTNVESNKTIYNKLIKEVCRLSGIHELVQVKLKDSKTSRYKIKEVPKYKAVSTHIGRRSYATNYYGIINTALLINATGHASEAQFLRYVGKTGNHNALALAKAMQKLQANNIKEPQMKVIKNVSNN
tara:strand:+ start:2719 stop:4050 length:1332 start_codon:yes stop_codon:yes gene_type:complete